MTRQITKTHTEVFFFCLLHFIHNLRPFKQKEWKEVAVATTTTTERVSNQTATWFVEHAKICHRNWRQTIDAGIIPIRFSNQMFVVVVWLVYTCVFCTTKLYLIILIGMEEFSISCCCFHSIYRRFLFCFDDEMSRLCANLRGKRWKFWNIFVSHVFSKCYSNIVVTTF